MVGVIRGRTLTSSATVHCKESSGPHVACAAHAWWSQRAVTLHKGRADKEFYFRVTSFVESSVSTVVDSN